MWADTRLLEPWHFVVLANPAAGVRAIQLGYVSSMAEYWMALAYYRVWMRPWPGARQ